MKTATLDALRVLFVVVLGLGAGAVAVFGLVALLRQAPRASNEPCVEIRGMTCCVVQAPGMRCIACDTGGLVCASAPLAASVAPAPAASPKPVLLP